MTDEPENIGAAEREVIELACERSVRAMGRIIELIEHEDPRVAITAANAVLDRAFGKPTQPISGDEDKPPVGADVQGRICL